MFSDRVEAGQKLGAALRSYTDCPGGLILAIPRGGVVVGREMSLMLHLPLDVLITRKIGALDNPELAIGAMSETGFLHINEELLAACPSLAPQGQPGYHEEQEEIARRRALYRGGRSLPPLAGRTVILVDDGVATGATYLASVKALRASQVGRLLAALPVAPSDTVQKIRRQVDDCVVLASPYPFYAVGQHYLDFRQVEDAEVLRSLAESWHPPADSAGVPPSS